MLGTLGALTILCLTFYVGFLFSHMQNGRQKRLECFLQLIRFIESEISCYQTPLDDIYRRFEGEELEKCGFTAVLREKGMTAALSECRGALCFSDEEYRLLVDFSGELVRPTTARRPKKNPLHRRKILAKQASRWEKSSSSPRHSTALPKNLWQPTRRRNGRKRKKGRRFKSRRRTKTGCLRAGTGTTPSSS